MEVSVSRGGKMEASLRWSVGLVAVIVCQVGCCSVQMNCGAPGCRVTPCSSAHPGSSAQPGGCEGECGMVGLEPLFHGHSHLKQKIHSWAASTRCASGCGEVYWGEHVSEPPTCDPCGMAGDYTGGCGSCRPWYSRLRDLWGYRYEPSGCSQGDGCSQGGCASCGGAATAGHFGGGHVHGSCASCNQGNVSEGEVTYEGESTHSSIEHATPTPAKPKANAAPTPVPDANASHKRRSGTQGTTATTATTTTQRVVRTSPTRIGSGVVQAGSVDPRIQLEASKRVQAQNVSAKERLTTNRR